MLTDAQAMPLVAQSDRTLHLEVRHPLFAEARRAIAPFAEVQKTHDVLHTYRLTPLSLWNAAAQGMTSDQVLATLARYAKFGVSPSLASDIRHTMDRYGLIQLTAEGERLFLTCRDEALLDRLARMPEIAPLLVGKPAAGRCPLLPSERGRLKQELLKLGYPVVDEVGYDPGEACRVAWRTADGNGQPFRLRPYQEAAIEAFCARGSGVLVLPCGAGKTVIGIGAICRLQTAALILTTNATSVRQWIRELRDKTDIPSELVGEYTGQRKEVRPITVATYQILTHRSRSNAPLPHLKLFGERNWGLIIYDEVHLLPAPVFRVTAGLQATRRLGLTATLVREDGREADVFSLIGPKLYELPWKELEEQGWIAEAVCREIRVPLDPLERERYAAAAPREKGRIAAENRRKREVVQAVLKRHRDDQVLIIGQYLRQLEEVARDVGAPLITGRVDEAERERLYRRFARGELKRLAVSKVANFAVDLPGANVAIQLSGTFGSRQEEAQRLGRILRPKPGDNRAAFYTLVTRDSCEQEWARNRQRFLLEQGYRYEVMDSEDGWC